VYSYDLANKKFMVFCNTAGGVDNPLGQHSAAAYAAGVTGDVINYIAIFAKA
jgi:hypothetical protein